MQILKYFFVKTSVSICLCKKNNRTTCVRLLFSYQVLIPFYFSIESNSTSNTSVLSGSIPLAPLEP